MMETFCSGNFSSNTVMFCFPAVLRKTKAANNLVFLVQALQISATGNSTKQSTSVPPQCLPTPERLASPGCLYCRIQETFEIVLNSLDWYMLVNCHFRGIVSSSCI